MATSIICNSINSNRFNINKISKSVNKLLSLSKKCSPNLNGDTWSFAGKNLTNDSYGNTSTLDEKNVLNLKEKYKSGISSENNGRAQTFVSSIALDEKHIYIVTHDDRDENGNITEQSGWPFIGGGYLIKFARADGKEIWRNKISTYTGVRGDYARGLCIYCNSIYFGSAHLFLPQTFNGLEKPIFATFAPGVPLSEYGGRRKFVSVDKKTGTLNWATEVGEVAKKYSDPDNWLFMTQSPIVFEVDSFSNPIVAVGSSSGQSFVPFLMADATCPVVSSNGSSSLLRSMYENPSILRMTDVGKIFLFDSVTGTIKKTIRVAPAFKRELEFLKNDSVIPGRNSVIVSHTIVPKDLEVGGEFNPVNLQNYNTTKMYFTLLSNSGIYPTLNAFQIPTNSPLIDQQVINNVGDIEIIKSGVVPNSLNLVTITLKVQFSNNGTEFNILEPIPKGPFNILNSSLTGYIKSVNPTIGHYPVRIEKVLPLGQTINISGFNIPIRLTEQDAYGLNYYGSSVWGSTLIVNKNELYATTGQNHSIPYDEVTLFNIKGLPSASGATFIERMVNIKNAHDAFDKTTDKLNNIRKAVNDALSDLKVRRSKVLSSRGMKNYHNSVIAIDLRENNFGNILWGNRTSGYDCWHVGFSSLVLRGNASTNPPTRNEGLSEPEAHFGLLSSPDGDFGEGAYLAKNKGFQNTDLIVAPNKGGTVVVMQVDIKNGPSVLNEVDFRFLGNPGLLGGSNFGSCLYNNNIYVLNTNESSLQNINIVNIDSKFSSLPLVFPPHIGWFPLSIDNPLTISPFEYTNSFISSYNFVNKKVEWEKSVVPVEDELNPVSGNYYATLCNLSCNKKLLFVHAANSKLYIKKLSDGSNIKKITLDTAGNSHAVILKDELYICSGRSTSTNGSIGEGLGDYNKGTQFVYKFSL